MGVNRKLLYWGVFFLAMGGVLVAADVNGFDNVVVNGLLQLWPLALIALGVGLLLRRTRASLAGGILAAAVPGLVLGGTFAAVPHYAAACGIDNGVPVSVQRGVFDGPARVELALHCGELSVTTTTGSEWQLRAGSNDELRAAVASTGSTLSIHAGTANGWWGMRAGDAWRIALPTAAPMDLSVDVGAGSGRLNLDGAKLGRADLNVGAGEARIDLRGATLTSLSGKVNAGALRLELPDADFTGDVEASFGEVRICAPDELGLRVEGSARFGDGQYAGLRSVGGGVWESPNYESAAHRAQLTVNVSFGSVKLNPRGGCL